MDLMLTVKYRVKLCAGIMSLSGKTDIKPNNIIMRGQQITLMAPVVQRPAGSLKYAA